MNGATLELFAVLALLVQLATPAYCAGYDEGYEDGARDAQESSEYVWRRPVYDERLWGKLS